MRSIDAAYMPPSARALVEAIGLAGTVRLVECYGGREDLYVPQTMTPGHEIARAIGHDAAVALAEIYGGDYIPSVPRCAAALQARRNADILARKRAGASNWSIAKEYQITERRVRQILGEERSPSTRPGQNVLPGLAGY